MEKNDIGETLKIGDFITLKSLKLDGFLCAEGILQEDVSVSSTGTIFDDTLFCVHLKRQYSASRELEDFLSQGPESLGTGSAKFLNALRRGRDNEKKLNDNYMNTRIGEDVKFGDVIQLYHVKSGKYLRVYPTQLAKNERQNLQLKLCSTGDIYSWLQLIPRFKIDRIGDHIQSNTEVYMVIAERSSEFIHIAEAAPIADRLREVNCSLEATSWKMTIFQSTSETKDYGENIVMASQVVYINDPELRCNLTVAKRPLEDLEVEEVTADSENYVHQYGDIVLEPMDDYANSRDLWFLESEVLVEGGPIKWKQDTVRFKHLNTGTYLRMVTKVDIDEVDGSEYDSFIFTTTRNRVAEGTLFRVNEMHIGGKLLHFDKPVNISQDEIYLERGAGMSDNIYAIKGSEMKSSAVAFKLFSYTERDTDVGGEDVDSACNDSEPLAVFSGVSCRNYLQKYYQMTAIPKSNTVSTIWEQADRSDLEFFGPLMNKILYFSQGFPISATSINLNVDKADDKLRIRRQHLLRDQGLLLTLLKLTNTLIPISNMVDDSPKLLKTASKISEEQQALISMGKEVLEKCFLLMYWAIKDHPENQMYVADHMPVLLEHLGGQPLAGKCVTEMLANNMELQETKIGVREIQIFVEKLRSSKMNSMYLQLLQACCSCQGSGVDGNQCKVTELLFSNTNDIIISLHSDYTRAKAAHWDPDSLYIAFTPIAGSPMAGEVLLQKGIPRLSLAWTTNSIDFSPLGLFGKLSVDVEDLYRTNGLLAGNSMSIEQAAGAGGDTGPLSPMAKKLRAKKSASAEQKLAVANYFISEMFLSAEMCMDRNYVAMHTLDSMFPYEVLVTILKIDVDSRLQSAAARVLLCLHIDRDPQAETMIPCLTRTWSEVVKSDDSEPTLPYVEPSRRNTYGLVQQILSEHIQSMANTRWTELSGHMMQLLKRMVSFNFYGTNQRMRDVIGPLIRALDRRSLSVSDDTASISYISAQPAPVSVPVQSFKAVPVMGEETREDPTMPEDAELSKQIIAGPRWEVPTLEFMESLPVMLFVLTVVVAAVGVVVAESVPGTNIQDETGSATWIFGILVLIFFCCEIGLRGYCALTVRDSPYAFFSNLFNQIDIFVILIDVVFLSLPANIGSKGGNVKVLRLIRLIRLLRVLRAARVVNRIVKIVRATSLDTWKTPARYSKVPTHELTTMVEAVNILQSTEKVIQDRNLTILLRYFYLWERGDDDRSPGELFEQVMADCRQLSLGIEDFDYVFVDLLMFTSTPLVQGCLEVLQAHHSTTRSLLYNASQIQLLVSNKRERQFKIVDQMLQQLERNAETHELWGELKCEADVLTSKQTKDIITELTEICCIKRTVLEFGQDFMSDKSIQDLLRNLGCFGICMKVMELADTVEEDEDGQIDKVSANTRDLCLLCNTLLYWFFLENPQNQELGYGELDFFLDTIDAKINSDLVVKSIFKMNEKLMRMVPHSHLRDFTDKICSCEKEQRSHLDLSLMLAVTSAGDKGIKENQLEIMKLLTSPARIASIASFFVPVDSDEYKLKQELMKPFLKTPDTTDFPLQLQYHFGLIEVMTGLTTGRMGGVTTIEAKVQSVYTYVDVIDALLDPAAILYAKIRIGMFFFNSVLEVELKVPGLEYAKSMWRVLQLCDTTLVNAEPLFATAEKDGLHGVNRRQLEFTILCIMMCGSFFNLYYDPKSYRPDEPGDENDTGDLLLTKEFIDELISSLLVKIQPIAELSLFYLSNYHKSVIRDAARVLKRCARGAFSLAEGASEELDAELSRVDGSASVGVANEEEEGGAGELGDGMDLSLEAKITLKYAEFLNALSTDEKVKELCDSEDTEFINILESIPFIIDDVASDIRQEPLFRKLVMHVRENFSSVNGERRLNVRCTKTTIWIIKAFRTMVENRMGMTIYERDDDGGEEQDIAAAPVIAALNACGATSLLLDLIAVGIDPDLQLEAIKLGVAMLFKEGGAKEVQGIMNNHLNSTESSLFFRQAKFIIQKLIEWHQWNDVIELVDGADVELPDNVIFVRLLQLMSEGHYLINQEIMRDQPNNLLKINLLEDFVQYLNTLSRIHCRTSTVASIRVAATILEVIQGPCVDNQSHFTMKTELLETLNRILRFNTVLDCDDDEELELKSIAIDIFKGLLEGQDLKGPIYERILNVIHMDILMMLSGNDKSSAGDDEKKEPSEGAEILQVESTVLLQLLCNCKPSLREELGLSNNPEDIVTDGTACVEVWWNEELHRVFFHFPDICEDMAKSSMDKLINNVDRSSLENQLTDFQERAHELYREIKHQQVLKALGISSIFSRGNHDKSTWFSFALAVVINSLYAVYYTRQQSPSHDIHFRMAETVGVVVLALNLLQIVLAIFNFVLVLIVKTPVKYFALLSQGQSPRDAALLSALEPMTVYYFMYLLFCFLGTFRSPNFLPFLLFDLIVKDASTMNVLMAIYQPRAQLGGLLVLLLFVNYIYSYFVFTYFRDDISSAYESQAFNCNTQWNCFKLVFCDGLRAGVGIGDFLNHSLGQRWLLDVSYSIFVLVLILNLIAGIIFMTFSVFREEKNEKQEKTENFCFICGIERLEFDRASEKGDGFFLHTKYDQNMWAYVKFMIFLWEQDRDDDDGLELYVRQCIENNDISWYPMNKALRLEEASSREEEMLAALKNKVNTTESMIAKKLADIQTEMSVVLEQVTQAIKSDHVGVKEDDEGDDIFGAFTEAGNKVALSKALPSVLESSGMVESKMVLPQNVCISLRHADMPSVVTSRFDRISSSVLNATNREYFFPGTAGEDAHVHAGGGSGSGIIGSVGASSRVFFSSQLVSVSRAACSQDDRVCRVQFFGERDEDQSLTLLAFVDLPVGQLVLADGCSVSKRFPLLAPLEAMFCTARVAVNCSVYVEDDESTLASFVSDMQ